jgi:putative oxidoreductase
MTIVRRLARPLLAASFIQEGLDAVLHPGKRTDEARPLVEAVAKPLGLPQDPELLIRANGAVMMGAGTLFALGRMPRLTGLALAATLAPGVYLHVMSMRTEKDGERRKAELDDLVRDLGRLGGALLAAVDTQGRPGLAWRGRHAAEHLGASTQRTTQAARRTTRAARRAARREARRAAKDARRAVGAD